MFEFELELVFVSRSDVRGMCAELYCQCRGLDLNIASQHVAENISTGGISYDRESEQLASGSNLQLLGKRSRFRYVGRRGT